MLEIDDHCVMDAARKVLSKADVLPFTDAIDLTENVQAILYLYLISEQNVTETIEALEGL